MRLQTTAKLFEVVRLLTEGCIYTIWRIYICVTCQIVYSRDLINGHSFVMVVIATSIESKQKIRPNADIERNEKWNYVNVGFFYRYYCRKTSVLPGC